METLWKLGLKESIARTKEVTERMKYFSLTSPAIVDVLTADSGVFVKFVTVTVTEEPNLVWNISNYHLSSF